MSSQVKDLKLTDTVFDDATDIINDAAETVDSTWSSDKVSSELENKLSWSRGNTASRPATLGATDGWAYYDTDTGGWVFWTGTKWSDQ